LNISTKRVIELLDDKTEFTLYPNRVAEKSKFIVKFRNSDSEQIAISIIAPQGR
jgi:cell division FtsZ-interacting protein ZapD